MNRIIRLLETIGQHPAARQALLDGDPAALTGFDLSQAQIASLLAGDGARLALLVGAPAIICCSLEKHDDDEDEEVPDRENEEIGVAREIPVT